MRDEQKVKEARSWLKGYQKGMEDAWTVMQKLTRRGMSGAELKIMVETEMASIPRAVEARKKAFEKALGFSLEEEKVSTSREIPPLESGQGYLVREERPDISFQIFMELLSLGKPSLCIVRTPPKKMRRTYSLPESVRLLWLTKSEDPNRRRNSSEVLTATLGLGSVDSVPDMDDGFLSPTNLSTILSIISDFLDNAGSGEEPVLLLEGVEYLITQNEFKNVLRFLQNVKEKVALKDAYFIVPITPDTMEAQQFKLIEKEMDVVI